MDPQKNDFFLECNRYIHKKILSTCYKLQNMSISKRNI